MNTNTLAENWHIAKGKLQQKYAQLTDHDLTFIQGREEDFVGRVQTKTGVSREELERYLREECHCW